MPVRLIESHPYIEETRNQLAVLRGPIVYCLESTDLPRDVHILDVRLAINAKLAPAADPRLPNITTLKGRATATKSPAWTNELYRNAPPTESREIDIQLVPYFTWDNRGQSEMTVWINQAH
jgi:DUF1680 family protein